MRTVGLLGGLSWVSSAEYYRLLNEHVNRELGGVHSASCVLVSVDFAEIERMQLEDRWDDAGRVLGEAARRLEAAGADVVLICSNTMHKVADDVQAAVGIPVLHIADVTAEAVKAAGVSKVALLGTRYVMEQLYLRDRLASHGLEVVVPEAADRAEVNRIIFEELVVDRFLENSREFYREVIRRLAATGVQGVILGCTEIELLVSAQDSVLPVFPTTRLHVQAAVNTMNGTIL
ncbi:aspartate/glutamate racemase family protein [Actinocrispum sp. NPDC049592]|uniref:aspartate/glutamate racemase family protein n=1 Tax=Actinocrispum sp. NPDC049592 TaxID=3154835 RepID=UPI00343F26DF